MGGVAVEFSPMFKFGIFFMDVDVLSLFVEQIAQGREQSEKMSFVGVFDVLELDGICCSDCCRIVAVHELVELWNEAVGTCLKNVIIEGAEVEEFFCFVAEVGRKMVFVNMVVELEVAEIWGRVFHSMKVGREGRSCDDVCQFKLVNRLIG